MVYLVQETCSKIKFSIKTFASTILILPSLLLKYYSKDFFENISVLFENVKYMNFLLIYDHNK